MENTVLNGVTTQNGDNGGYVNYNKGSYIIFNNLNVTKGTIPSESQYNGIIFGDNTAGANSTYTDRLGVMECCVANDGGTFINIGTYPNITDEISYPRYGVLQIGTSQDGVGVLNFNDKPVIIKIAETKGSSWYRKYSDGWIEQGGIISNNSSTTIVTFKVAFSNINYTLTGGLLNGTASTSYEHMNFNTLTTTGFKFTTYDNYGVRWYACGY